jgi:hypothetical protein
MQMSAELFQTIVQSVRSDDSAVENDKRRSQRCSFRGKAQIVPPGASARVWTDVRDLSVEGIGLVHGSPLKCGQEFTLALDTATSDGQQGVVCTVARWQPISEREFLIGAKFTRTVTNAGQVEIDPVADLVSRLRTAGHY